MARVALVTFLALAGGPAWGQDPPDAGGEQPPATAPQMEDREAPPMPGQKAKAPEAQPAEPRPAGRSEPKAEPKAAPAPAQREAPAPAEPPAKPPRITVHTYDEDSAGVMADTVEAAIAEELLADSRVHFATKADLLIAPEKAPRLLGEADVQSMDADEALAQGDVEKAKQLLEKALRSYQLYLPQLAGRGGGLDPFRDAWLKMARARFFDGDQKGARDALRFAFVLDPTVKWDPNKFPAAMKKVVVEARLLFDTLGTGVLNLDSDPPGATVYLNGKKLDKVTPVDGVQAPPGPNYISYVRRDWAPVSAIFEVAGGGEQASAVRALEHFQGRPLQPLYRARGDLDKAEPPSTLQEAADKLSVDMLVLVRLSKAEGGTKLMASLYDARPRRILKRAEKIAPDGELGPAARELVKELTSGVRLDGVWLVPAPPKQPSLGDRIAARMKAFRQSKAFWYVVGGVAGAIVVGTAVGVGVGVGGQQHGLTPGEQIILIGGR